MKLIIVGGVAGGASAAARARRLSEDAEILVIERGPDVSFANCGLPYHIGEMIPDRNKLLVVTPERLRERFRLDVRVRTQVESIDRANHTVTLRNLLTGITSQEHYDKLILAPGAAPLRPEMPGLDLPNVFTLRNLQDMDRIKQAIDAGTKQVVLVGAGFIGLELAENMVHRGIQTTVIERNPQILTPFDPEMTTPLAATLRQHGVQLKLNDSTRAIRTGPDGLIVELASGESLPAQVVILGIGVRPENKLAVDAGLETGPRGGIRVNDRLQTSDPDIYAVGDVIETVDFNSQERTQVPLAGPANRQGRIAADQVFGRDTRYRGTQGTAIVGFFGKIGAMTGSSEKTLKRLNRPYLKAYIHPAHHASYYPGAEGMTLKLLYDPDTGKILGAQGVGGAGVDKRIDVLAMAIQAGMTVYQLEESELCYAPQFGSAKDPINMLGFVAAGRLRGEHPQINWEELAAARDSAPAASGLVPWVVDVRTPLEYAKGHIPDAVNLPVDELRQRLHELPRDRPIVAYCQVGQRGYLATRVLTQAGFSVNNLSGGYQTYLLHHPT
ncbi:FAD-dependent oxidoreductase [Tuwongella immobilis]|uniref:Rhodanese domain-containing protein n=1 Tax=Tuwongella immobilis TaxID=692036 RepID=A0A6C2YHU2_9BACT|nr:FAD-dependent oxidoreductase [Tuwongella immobilis]VIP00934.1 -disulfide reductase : FAD-dependent pyridine nucleotide-disulfide oxidoreductase OS=Isosphaera pallida (strain ATCC 43644 / DSM 9630 / IS1B) GN=Isop_2700 PE=4 SV=1: Pyr_redox_2: Pyr_redox: Pyr_redox_2: Pyr_redox_dim: Rhodanese [Tuwongella immobilis]VTR97286.1 -disulfide reductase : FAD-dependent pyridine nucleotide-disulfide oxidoreductase OS=Isosphaera pallida (strain ATCC 43644 / DSM 9630 / IS1B) GN=Isop_2700 PE=4 SV=1: Pyr_redox